ncbi:nestin [Cololabis saira]|uniref:nestin n=1 Tax=Cololabis saira TaxID=129043 RepID=UPI002AD26491|nr:nestin [Cololabis saira]
MEFHSISKLFHPHHPGEEKQQMLNLNRRLETYLSRVKLLEEENTMLAREIQTMRHNNQGASVRRKDLEEELLRARLEVDAAWRDKVLTEMEIGKLTEDLQTLNLQRQREAQAQVTAKKKLEQSRKEMEEEQRAQIWLREKVNQLEHEMRLVIQTHGEDVAHLEVELTRSRAVMPQRSAQRATQAPELLVMGQELSQKANRAWQEAAEAYQGQLARLEESLDQAKSRLNQVGQEKLECQLNIQALKKEMASAQDVRLHLDKTVTQKRDRYCQEIQQFQEHLQSLEMEKEELGQQITHLLQENHGLMQLKMSLGLEVSTYRALLDNESHRRDTSRNVVITDAYPHRVTKMYKPHLSANRKTTFPSSVYGVAGPTLMTATPYRTRKPLTSNETSQISRKPADTAESATLETSYPKIIQDGAVENFRPQEVQEKVTYAEPLSPPNEEETPAETPEDRDEDDWRIVDAEAPDERPVVESVVSHKVESGLNGEPFFNDEPGLHEFTTPSLMSPSVRMTEEPFTSSDELDSHVADATFHKALHLEDECVQKVNEQVDDGKATAEEMSYCAASEGAAGKGDVQQLFPPADANLEVDHVDKEEEHVEEEETDDESQVLLEPTIESQLRSLKSEYEPVESVFEKDAASDDAVETRQEMSGLMAEVNGVEVEKLYPDGEEMDTWDSVIEKKADVGTVDGIINGGKNQHAEPEEDISTKDSKNKIGDLDQDGDVERPLTPTQTDDGRHAELDQEQAPPPDKEEDNDNDDDVDDDEDEEEDDDEDSQNVSVSWRTELESDSYALDNTLADPRPLIRYKSDETDGNAQQIDESESSEGEQEKKMKEAGPATWSDGKSKTFGTMEDLCEEVEEETIDDEYNLGYTHIEDVSQSTVVSICATAENDTEKATEMGRNDSDSEEETEELARPVGLDYDEELETDRLVEQELERLSTDRYTTHFAQQQVGDGMLHLEDESVQEVTEQDKAGKAVAEYMSCEPEESANKKHVSFTAFTDQASAKPHVSDSSMAMSLTDFAAEEDIIHKCQEEDENNMSMLTYADVTDHGGFGDLSSRADMEETNESDDPNSVLPETADEKNMEVTEPEEHSNESQSKLDDQAHGFHEIHEDKETPEFEVLENSTLDFEDEDHDDEDHDDEDHDDEDHDDEDHDDDEVAVIHQEKRAESSPETVVEEHDIYIVKEATDSAPRDLFPSGVKNDFWVSSLESSATYEHDDACNNAAEQTYQDPGLVDKQGWGNLQNPNVVNGNSRVDDDSSKASEGVTEQEWMRTDKRKFHNIAETFPSEESEIEAGSWSSGE